MAVLLAAPRAARPREGFLSRGRCVLSVLPPAKADPGKNDESNLVSRFVAREKADTRYAHRHFFSMRSSQEGSVHEIYRRREQPGNIFEIWPPEDRVTSAILVLKNPGYFNNIIPRSRAFLVLDFSA